MRKIWFIISVSFIALILYYSSVKFFVKENNINKVCFEKNCFLVELAITNAEREVGLMNRTSLDKNKGMLFIFDGEGNYPFWMKNTLIPLDMIWLDKNYKVVYVAENVQPCKIADCPIINPNINAKYVLEINAGLTKEFNIKINDYANFTAKKN